MKNIFSTFLLFTLFLLSACGTNNDGSLIGTLPQPSSKTSPLKNATCSQLLHKKYYEICYDYGAKGALFVAYTLDGRVVNNPNITQRFSFYEEDTIPLRYRSDSDDYRGSGYDRGHMASDASFDYNQSALYSVYSMANIVPQNPDVNRYSWIDTEFLERDKAVEYGKVSVVIAIVYSDNPERIGKDDIAVPSGFYKKIYNTSKNYEACYFYENIPYDIASDTLTQHQVACNYFPFY
jgi:endonuclease G